MTTFKYARGAATMVAALVIGTAADAQAPRCMAPAAARLVCDQDGCVRPRSDRDCLAVAASIVRTDRAPRRMVIPARVGRDEIALLLARLN